MGFSLGWDKDTFASFADGRQHELRATKVLPAAMIPEPTWFYGPTYMLSEFSGTIDGASYNFTYSVTAVYDDWHYNEIISSNPNIPGIASAVPGVPDYPACNVSIVYHNRMPPFFSRKLYRQPYGANALIAALGDMNFDMRLKKTIYTWNNVGWPDYTQTSESTRAPFVGNDEINPEGTLVENEISVTMGLLGARKVRLDTGVIQLLYERLSEGGAIGISPGVLKQLNFTQWISDYLAKGRNLTALVCIPIMIDFTYTPGTITGAPAWVQFMLGIFQATYSNNIPASEIWSNPSTIQYGRQVKMLDVTWQAATTMPDLYLTTYRTGYTLERGNRIIYRVPGSGWRTNGKPE